jgi:hypothetical protein
MQIYTIEQLGPKRSVTPQGFLLCRDVPIARTGDQIYLEQEIGPGENGERVEGGVDGTIIVTRDAQEVFTQEAIDSFEGMPITDDHPVGNVTTGNWHDLAVGYVRNVRRGMAEFSGCLVADLLICAKNAIDAVENGKRQVSCGYNAIYDQIVPGRARQVNIRGNHVALVDDGRCGPLCAIGDRQTARETKMAATNKKLSWLDRARGAFKAKDENLFEEALEMASEDIAHERHVTVNVGNGGGGGGGYATFDKRVKDSDEEEEKEKKKDDDETKDKALKPILDKLTSMETRLGAVESFIKDSKKTKDTEEGAETPKGEEEEKQAKKSETKDTDEEGDDDDKKKKDTKDSKPRNLVNARLEWQDTLARGEILMPGVRLPTFDSAQDSKTIDARLCAFRRRVVAAAYETDHGITAIKPYLGGSRIDTLTCDAVKVLFAAASDNAKTANMNRRGNVIQPPGRGLPKTNEEINAIHREYYAKR